MRYGNYWQLSCAEKVSSFDDKRLVSDYLISRINAERGKIDIEWKI